jgi:excisionase family DNA binding protein
MRSELKMGVTRQEIDDLYQSGLSYAEIARRLGLTRERVRQIITGVSTMKKKPYHDERDILLTTSEAAELLNVHVNTVRRWSNKGLLETYYIGPRRDRRFKRSEIYNFLLCSKNKRTGAYKP